MELSGKNQNFHNISIWSRGYFQTVDPFFVIRSPGDPPNSTELIRHCPSPRFRGVTSSFCARFPLAEQTKKNALNARSFFIQFLFDGPAVHLRQGSVGDGSPTDGIIGEIDVKVAAEILDGILHVDRLHIESVEIRIEDEDCLVHIGEELEVGHLGANS